MSRPARRSNYTIRRARRYLPPDEDPRVVVRIAEETQRRLRREFLLRLDAGVHPQFAGVDRSLFAREIAEAKGAGDA